MVCLTIVLSRCSEILEFESSKRGKKAQRDAKKQDKKRPANNAVLLPVIPERKGETKNYLFNFFDWSNYIMRFVPDSQSVLA